MVTFLLFTVNFTLNVWLMLLFETFTVAGYSPAARPVPGCTVKVAVPPTAMEEGVDVDTVKPVVFTATVRLPVALDPVLVTVTVRAAGAV